MKTAEKTADILSATVITSKFTLPQRKDKEIILKKHDSLKNALNIDVVLDALPYMTLILNESRQIVFCNKAFLAMIHISKIEKVLGSRPEEIIHCAHSDRELDIKPYGFGTAESCQVCGAVRMVMRCIKNEKVKLDETHITVDSENGNDLLPLDILVSADPFEFKSEKHIIVTMHDISDEKQRQVLEKIFLHDIANVVSGIVGIVEFLKMDGRIDRINSFEQLSTATHQLYNEMQAHQQLLRGEIKKLELKPDFINVEEFLNDVALLHQKNPIGKPKHVIVKKSPFPHRFYSDRTLLFRVLCNMVKNAVEASGKNEVVTISCELTENMVTFKVHNPSFIPHIVQLQVFQRSFSTHGKGRGLGTYSMKMLSEQYLKGKVSFRSTETDGTTFSAEYPIDLRTVAKEIIARLEDS